jgi:hypothetical protein
MKRLIAPLLLACLLSTPAAASAICTDPACVDLDAGVDRDASGGLGSSPSVTKDAGPWPAPPSEVVVAPPPPPPPPPETTWAVDWVNLILISGGILWAMVSAIVHVTPTKRDDELLRVIAERFSFLRASNVPSGILGPLSLPGTRPQPNREGI